jgi:hypothetical protein
VPRAGPLTIASIAGKSNDMADIACRSYNTAAIVPNSPFLTHFKSHFPLPQDLFWKLVHLTPAMTLLVISTLAGKRLPLQQWMTSFRQKTGTQGSNYVPMHDGIPTSSTPLSRSNNSSSWSLLQGSDMATTVKDVQSKLRPRKQALRHVAKTIVLAGYPDPQQSYRCKDLDLPFAKLLRSYKLQDPAPKPQLALPVRAVQCAVDFYRGKQTPVARTIADHLTVAFFFLLRPGEYTMPTSQSKTCTVQF